MNIKSILSIVLMVATLAGCHSAKQNKRTLIGAGAGAAVGGALGALLGRNSGNSTGAIIVGAAVGGVAGGAIGRYMDKQAKDLDKDLRNAKVERVGEGIKVTFDSGILFAVNSDKLSPQAQESVRKLAETLNKYEDTNVLIDGHTDNTGKDAYNQSLSEKRAAAVSSYLQSLNVKNTRLGTRGLGETQPVAENTTETGRQQNRRVEVAVWANDKLKKAAETGDVLQSK
jgi:outer membrane protein OmpA-like peptidoglycan-associated protein